MGSALRSHYGFGKADTGFLDGFANLPALEDRALEIIQDDLNNDVPPHQIAWAARMIQSYEAKFWDAMAAAADAEHIAGWLKTPQPLVLAIDRWSREFHAGQEAG